MANAGILYLLPEGSFFQNPLLTLDRPPLGLANNLLETESHDFVMINRKGVTIKYRHSLAFQTI